MGWGGKSDQTALGLKGLVDLLHFAHDQGVTFWDSADQYGSHSFIKESLKGLDRSSVVITSKTVSRTRNRLKTMLNDS